MMTATKRTPEEVRQQRLSSLQNARNAKAAKQAAKPKLVHTSETAAAPAEFMGLTMKDCAVGCTPERCVIAGSLIFKNEDGEKSLVGHCGHPKKGGLQAIHQTNMEIVKRYNRAKIYLEQLEIDKKK